MAAPRDDNGFSGSDQAWWDRLTGRDAAQPPADRAQREGELLRRALKLERGGIGREVAPSAPEQADLEASWQRARARLQQEGLLDQPAAARSNVIQGPWRRAAAALALAAGLSVVYLAVEPLMNQAALYDAPPTLRSAEVERLRLPVAAPRAEAEALARTLRDSGWKAGLYQRGREFIIDTTVDAGMPADAAAALAARGVRTQAGSVRLEFVPR